jgi:hypothetical protein
MQYLGNVARYFAPFEEPIDDFVWPTKLRRQTVQKVWLKRKQACSDEEIVMTEELRIPSRLEVRISSGP